MTEQAYFVVFVFLKEDEEPRNVDEYELEQLYGNRVIAADLESAFEAVVKHINRDAADTLASRGLRVVPLAGDIIADVDYINPDVPGFIANTHGNFEQSYSAEFALVAFLRSAAITIRNFGEFWYSIRLSPQVGQERFIAISTTYQEAVVETLFTLTNTPTGVSVNIADQLYEAIVVALQRAEIERLENDESSLVFRILAHDTQVIEIIESWQTEDDIHSWFVKTVITTTQQNRHPTILIDRHIRQSINDDNPAFVVPVGAFTDEKLGGLPLSSMVFKLATEVEALTADVYDELRHYMKVAAGLMVEDLAFHEDNNVPARKHLNNNSFSTIDTIQPKTSVCSASMGISTYIPTQSGVTVEYTIGSICIYSRHYTNIVLTPGQLHDMWDMAYEVAFASKDKPRWRIFKDRVENAVREATRHPNAPADKQELTAWLKSSIKHKQTQKTVNGEPMQLATVTFENAPDECLEIDTSPVHMKTRLRFVSDDNYAPDWDEYNGAVWGVPEIVAYLHKVIEHVVSKIGA